jgi:hypothetical protein
VLAKVVTTSVKSAQKRDRDAEKAAKTPAAGGECGGEYGGDGDGEFDNIFAQSDIEDDAPAVDTDHASLDESGNTTCSASSTGSDSDAAKNASRRRRTEGCQPQTAATPKMPKQVTPGGIARSFDNGYFHIKGRKIDEPYLRMFIHQKWVVPPPYGIGEKPTMSKSITISSVGDADKDPMRTTILLKAWMLWRVGKHPGWLAINGSRQRLFTEEADQLCLEVMRIQPQNDGLLGNIAATKMLRGWVSDLVPKMTKPAACGSKPSACGSVATHGHMLANSESSKPATAGRARC